MTSLALAMITVISILVVTLIGILFFMYKRRQALNGPSFSSIASESSFEDNRNEPVINLAEVNIEENLHRHSQILKTGPLAKSTNQAFIEGHPALMLKNPSFKEKSTAAWAWQLQTNDNNNGYEPTPSSPNNNSTLDERRLSSGGNVWYPSYVGGPTAGVGGSPLNMIKDPPSFPTPK
ncbi:unnamed protein product [Dimorphilus gyrociliatus]|uniref:Uncharacterized protein n=1 Tax=Dimorphilus gyrociliatus TaxID=2664684 RepID=A0A7I8VFV3_9ANNE|nr:unnamed protein product [Dimorphilus gyrociliatus]